MFSISQIILIALSLLLIGAVLVFSRLFVKGKHHLTNNNNLMRYFAVLLFIIFICCEITYILYYSKFLYYFGMNAAILILVSFAILAIPAYGLLPREKLHSIEFVKKNQAPVLPAESIPLIIEPEGLKIKEEPSGKPAELQYEPVTQEEIKQEVKLPEPIEKTGIIEEVKEEVKIIPAETEAQVVDKSEAKPIHVEHKKAAPKKVTAKKPPAKKEIIQKEEVKKAEITKEEAKPVEVKHVKTAHPKATHTKAGTEKPKQSKQTKPRTKK